MLVRKLNNPEVEIPACEKIDQDNLGDGWTSADWLDVSTNQFMRLFVLFEQCDVVGFSLWQVDLVDHFAHLLKIAIDKGYQGVGFGAFLLNESESELAKEGVSKFYLEVSSLNTTACTLYLKYQYRQINKINAFYKNGDDALILYKEV